MTNPKNVVPQQLHYWQKHPVIWEWLQSVQWRDTWELTVSMECLPDGNEIREGGNEWVKWKPGNSTLFIVSSGNVALREQCFIKTPQGYIVDPNPLSQKLFGFDENQWRLSPIEHEA